MFDLPLFGSSFPLLFVPLLTQEQKENTKNKIPPPEITYHQTEAENPGSTKAFFHIIYDAYVYIESMRICLDLAVFV